MQIKHKDLYSTHLHFLLLGILVFVTNLISIRLIPYQVGVITSLVWVVLSIIIYFSVRKRPKGLKLYAYANACIAGITMSACYTYKMIPNVSIFLTLSTFGIILFLLYSLRKRFLGHQHYLKIELAMMILACVYAIYTWIFQDMAWGCMLTFMMALFLCFNLSYYFYRDRSATSVDVIGLTSLLMFASVLFITLMIITESDIVNPLDLEFSFKGKKKTT